MPVKRLRSPRQTNTTKTPVSDTFDSFDDTSYLDDDVATFDPEDYAHSEASDYEDISPAAP